MYNDYLSVLVQARGQTDNSITIGYLDDTMVDVFGKLWMHYLWPSSQWRTQDCTVRKPVKKNVIEISDCNGGITIRYDGCTDTLITFR